MNIGFVYAYPEVKITGVNRLIRETVNELLKLDSENNYYSVEDNYLCLGTVYDNCVEIMPNDVDARNIICYLKEIDILHSFYNTFDTVKCKAKRVLSVNDITPLTHPEWFVDVNIHAYFRDRIRKSAEMSDMIVAISESTKNDVVNYYNIPEERVKVVYPGLFSALNFETTGKSAIFNLGLQEGYILSVCTLDPRKNLIGMIKGFVGFKKLHPKSKIKLVLTGGERIGYTDLQELISDLGIYKNDIVLTGYVSDEVLSELYVHALAVAYVSFYEGFGLPILEAMAAGKAVISSNTSSMPEVGGDAVLYCDPYEEESISNAIERIVINDSLRKELERKSVDRARIFSYRRSAEEMLQVYRSLV